jgi:hypothetical protein
MERSSFSAIQETTRDSVPVPFSFTGIPFFGLHGLGPTGLTFSDGTNFDATTWDNCAQTTSYTTGLGRGGWIAGPSVLRMALIGPALQFRLQMTYPDGEGRCADQDQRERNGIHCILLRVAFNRREPLASDYRRSISRAMAACSRKSYRFA